MIRLRCLLPVAMLSACVGGGGGPPVADRAAPVFAPAAFFAGRTEGDGRLDVVLSAARTVRVHGRGTVAPDGTLTLVQRIAEGGRPERSRTWVLRPTAAGTYAGTLSDAVGGVVAVADRNRLHIRFRARGGIAVEQWLTLQPGGRVAHNRLVARRFGVRVAVLDETIRKVD